MSRYLIALGSNMRHRRHGAPERVLRAALAALDDGDLALEACSPIVASAPLGPSRRRYANAAATVITPLAPLALLARLQAIERGFGRRRRGARWRARVLDLDIVLWESGPFADARLIVPHPRFRERGFVLGPALCIAADWRDPLTSRTVRHLHARLTRPRPSPTCAERSARRSRCQWGP